MASFPLLKQLRRIGRARSRPGTPARLFLKNGCGLCAEALELLRPIQARGRLQLELVDIAADPVLFRRYCLSIPVLVVHGAELAWPFDRTTVERALASRWGRG